MARTGPHTVAGKAIAKDQAALAKLPHREVDNEYDDYSSPLVFALCHYTGKDPEPIHRGFPEQQTIVGYKCRYCGFLVETDAPLPKHSRIINKRDQLRETVDTVCEVLGIDPWSDAGNRASYSPQHENRGAGLDGQLGEALNILAAALFRRDAIAGLGAAVEALDTVEMDGDEFRFMSEGTLYERLGKSDARTVLALWGDVKRAAGR